jgi:alcohol dehydrogenase (cytochrome c)
VWGTAVGDTASYSSIIKAKIENVDQYINFMSRGIISVRAKDGQFLWRYDAPATKDKPNCATCLVSGNSIFDASAYNTGGGRADIKLNGDKLEANEVYFVKKFQNHHGGMILHNGMVYGSADPMNLTCLDFKTGDVKWSEKSTGKCSLLLAEGLLYCRDEKGPISLVEARPDGFKLKGRFDQPDRSKVNSWPYLVISNGKLYVRDQDVLLCYDVRAK